jgi:hypothetical protein
VAQEQSSPPGSQKRDTFDFTIYANDCGGQWYGKHQELAIDSAVLELADGLNRMVISLPQNSPDTINIRGGRHNEIYYLYWKWGKINIPLSVDTLTIKFAVRDVAASESAKYDLLMVRSKSKVSSHQWR